VCVRARVCVYVCVPVYDVCAHGCGGGGGRWVVCVWVGGWVGGGGWGGERERETVCTGPQGSGLGFRV
jgi:hypothetical protein